jgi:DNA-binding NtrC family response regulator
MARILVVDDEEVACEELCELLIEEGYEAVGVHDGEMALAAADEESFDLCITDIRMPGMSGIELLGRLHQTSPETLVILITAFGDMESAIAALQKGASDYLLKPLKFDQLLPRIQRIIEGRSLAMEVRRQRLSRQMTFGFRLAGRSLAMREVRRRLIEVAATQSHLLLVGEPGTGRAQAARAVHAAGTPASRFTTLDCTVLGELESAGFEDLLRRTAGGTLFLVDPKTLSASLQEDLEHALANAAAETRVVAAGEGFYAAVVSGSFRSGLYDLLAAEKIELPPLRERREDVVELAQHLVAEHRDAQGFSIALSDQGLEHLLGYSWPGNVAELEAAIESTLAKAEGLQIVPGDLPEAVRSTAPLSPSELLPDYIGAYRIESRLGAGGMAEVYRGYDEQLRRPVAIKRVSAELADPEKRARLRQEARTAAKLKHRSIVQIYHLLEDEEQDHIVMELVEGETLGRRLLKGPLAISQSVAVASGIAAGLVAAHEEGIVHRDLKTENIILTPSGQAKILDFGIAKPLHDESSSGLITEDDQLVGTHHAMSPEHVMGEEADLRSDLFSFGSLLYEMVTGKRPFAGSTPMKTLVEICTKRQTSVRQLDPRIPAELSDLIDRLLEKEPDDRIQSATLVLTALNSIRATLDPASEPVAAKGEEDSPQDSSERELTETVTYVSGEVRLEAERLVASSSLQGSSPQGLSPWGRFLGLLQRTLGVGGG